MSPREIVVAPLNSNKNWPIFSKEDDEYPFACKLTFAIS